MQSDSSRSSRQLVLLYLACYGLWIGLSALGVWLIFQVRSSLFILAVLLRFNPWVVRAIDQFGIVTLGLLWLVGMLMLESYLRQGVVKHRLWKRAARVFVFEIAVLGLCYMLEVLIA
jgi:hypothetical protein